MSRYEKPTPPDRPAVGYADETPTDPYSQPMPLRAPSRLGSSRRRFDEAETSPEGLGEITLRAELHRCRDEIKALRTELRQQACDLASVQSQLLSEVRGPSVPRQRWSDAPATQRTISALIGALLVAVVSAVAQRYGVHVTP